MQRSTADMQAEGPRRYHFMSVGMASFKNMENNFGQDMKEREYLCADDRDVN